MTYTHLNTHLIFVSYFLDIKKKKKTFWSHQRARRDEVSSYNYIYGEVVSDEN
jgi:hypothetical protein